MAQGAGAIDLALERPSDLARATDIEAFCAANPRVMIVLDEVQRRPDIFSPLHGGLWCMLATTAIRWAMRLRLWQ